MRQWQMMRVVVDRGRVEAHRAALAAAARFDLDPFHERFSGGHGDRVVVGVLMVDEAVQARVEGGPFGRRASRQARDAVDKGQLVIGIDLKSRRGKRRIVEGADGKFERLVASRRSAACRNRRRSRAATPLEERKRFGCAARPGHADGR